MKTPGPQHTHTNSKKKPGDMESLKLVKSEIQILTNLLYFSFLAVKTQDSIARTTGKRNAQAHNISHQTRDQWTQHPRQLKTW